jgi:hypothetical protein
MNKYTGLMGGLLLALCAPLANAALTINYSINGSATQLCGNGADTGPVVCNIVGSGVAATVVTAVSNSPGTPGEAELLGDSVQVTSTGNNTLKIWITAQNFTMPTGVTIFESGLTSNSTLLNTSGSLGLQSCVDNANGTAPALGCSGGSLVNPTQTLAGGQSASSTVFGTANAVSKYSLEQALTLTLHAGTDFNTTTTTSLEVPEPNSMLLFGSLLVGVSILARRKNKKAAN